VSLSYARPRPGPGTHALLVGVGRYRYLTGGPEPRDAVIEAVGPLGQLGSPPLSAALLAAFLSRTAACWQPPLQTVELLIPRRRRVVNRLAIQRAYGRWRRRCDSDPGNLALAYFGGHGLQLDDHYLLPEDLGAEPLRPWANAINLDRTARGFRRCRAGGQVFWFDTCRQATSAALVQGALDAQPLESPALRQVDRRDYGVVLRATGPGAAAYGRHDAPSIFMTALLAALSGEAALPFEGRRQLTCGSLAMQLNHILTGLSGPGVQRCEADELVDGPLLAYPERGCSEEGKPRTRCGCPTKRTTALVGAPGLGSESMTRQELIEHAHKQARAAMTSLKAAQDAGYGDLKRANLDTATERAIEAVFALAQALKLDGEGETA